MNISYELMYGENFLGKSEDQTLGISQGKLLYEFKSTLGVKRTLRLYFIRAFVEFPKESALEEHFNVNYFKL